MRPTDPLHDRRDQSAIADFLQDRHLHLGRLLALALVPAVLLVIGLWAAGLMPSLRPGYLLPPPAAPIDAASAARANEIAELRLQRDAYLGSPASGEGSVQDMTPEQAIAANAAMPVSTLPNPRAAPFILAADAAEKARALECLTAAVYYEAANESDSGQRAVAQVVLNRVRHPAYPKTICGVVYEGSELRTGCQFTFTCDGALGRAAIPALWARARLTAQAALSGSVMAGVGLSTHYHADYVVPYWASRLVKVAKIGAHIFYRWPGGWGQPAAFNGAYGVTGAPSDEEAAPAAPAPVVPLPPLPPLPAPMEIAAAPPPEPVAPPVMRAPDPSPPPKTVATAPAPPPAPAASAPIPAKAAPQRTGRIAAPSGW